MMQIYKIVLTKPKKLIFFSGYNIYYKMVNRMNSGKKPVKLTEGMLKDIISESVRNILKEVAEQQMAEIDNVCNILSSMDAKKISDARNYIECLTPEGVAFVRQNKPVYYWVIYVYDTVFCSPTNFKSGSAAESNCNKFLKKIKFNELIRRHNKSFMTQFMDSDMDLDNFDNSKFDFDMHFNIYANVMCVENEGNKIVCDIASSNTEGMWMD